MGRATSVRWRQLETETKPSLEVIERDFPDPGQGQVQISVGSAGICGSDLHFYRGDFPARPGITPGHEFAGAVSAVGAGISNIKEGDIVGVEPLLRCGYCAFCMSGDYHVCGDRGLIGENENGGMSDYANVPSNTVFKAPAGVDPELGALAEPLACSVHGFHKIGLRGHETIFIVGAGTIGLTAILAARANGAHVIVLARHPHQQEAARLMGADEVIGEDEAGTQRMKELAQIQAIDVSVETVGGQGDTLIQAQRMVRPKGRVLVLGVFSVPTVPINPLHLALREVEIVGSMTYSSTNGRADYAIALDVISDYSEAARSLVTHRFGLNEVDLAFAAAMDKSSESLKVHFNPSNSS